MTTGTVAVSPASWRTGGRAGADHSRIGAAAYAGSATADQSVSCGEFEDEDDGEGPVHFAAELGLIPFAIYPARAPKRGTGHRSGGGVFPGCSVASPGPCGRRASPGRFPDAH